MFPRQLSFSFAVIVTALVGAQSAFATVTRLEPSADRYSRAQCEKKLAVKIPGAATDEDSESARLQWSADYLACKASNVLNADETTRYGAQFEAVCAERVTKLYTTAINTKNDQPNWDYGENAWHCGDTVRTCRNTLGKPDWRPAGVPADFFGVDKDCYPWE